jgi:hypothetical protein
VDTLNITIDGHLGMPGFSRVRVPPPFGTPRDIIQAIESRRAKALSDEVLSALAVGNQVVARGWRKHPRLTVLAIGVACTVVAALVGLHTGQHRQPLPQFEHAPPASAAQETPAPVVPVESLDEVLMASRVSSGTVVPAPTEAAANPTAAEPMTTPLAMAAAPAPVAAPVVEAPAVESAAPARAAPATKPRTLARAAGRSAPRLISQNGKPVPAMPMEAEEAPVRYTDAAPTATYVAPSMPAMTIQFQRHTRLTD